MENAIVPAQDAPQAIVKAAALSLGELKNQVNLVQQFMRGVMQDGQHYGKIPGCGDKPALFKSGAEKLAFAFHLVPTFRITERQLDGGHREYQIVATIATRSGEVVAEGVGSCSTMESKYRYRQGQRRCPKCKMEAIIKGKAEFGGGWLCFTKRGGCGAKWADGAKEIEGQHADRVENQDIADQYNTVLKMAKKRAFVDATITATATSDIFTQDIEETHEVETPMTPPPVDAPPARPLLKQAVAATPTEFMDPPAGLEPHAVAPAASNGDTVTEVATMIKSIGYREGEKNGKKWQLFTLDTEHGEFKTFDKKFAESAKAAKECGAVCILKWKPGRRPGEKDLVGVEVVTEPTQEGGAA